MSESKIPKVSVIKALSPTHHPGEERLTYGNLPPIIAAHRPYEYRRLNNFWDADRGSLEEESCARDLARQYLLMTAQQLQDTEGGAGKQLLSERYTAASIELYGMPNRERARQLLLRQRRELAALNEKPGVDKDLLDGVLSFADTGDDSDEVELPLLSPEAMRAAREVGSYLQTRYSEAFSALTVEGESETTIIDVDSLGDRFEAALSELAQVDNDWSKWKVQRDPELDTLSCQADNLVLVIGMKRADVSLKEVKALFAHEVLLHAQRAVNGSKLNPLLGLGLPEYEDTEEGLGTYFEFAITGEIPQKNIDRYIDISLAAGQMDERSRTYQEMLEFVTVRAVVRRQAEGDIGEEELIRLMAKARAHTDRIYRGTLGDDKGGVFTKDVAYQAGFDTIATYVEGETRAGKSIAEMIEYLLLGKFDPTKKSHRDFLEQVNSNWQDGHKKDTLTLEKASGE